MKSQSLVLPAVGVATLALALGVCFILKPIMNASDPSAPPGPHTGTTGPDVAGIVAPRAP